MSEKAPSQCSFLMRLHKLLALNETDVVLVRRTQSNFAPAKPISGPEQCRLPDITHSNLKSGGRLMDTPAEFRKGSFGMRKPAKERRFDRFALARSERTPFLRFFRLSKPRRSIARERA
jgi:hypothetical protein